MNLALATALALAAAVDGRLAVPHALLGAEQLSFLAEPSFELATTTAEAEPPTAAPAPTSTPTAAAADGNDNGRCDAEFCACYVTDPEECPSWMNADLYSRTKFGHIGSNNETGMTVCLGHSANFFEGQPFEIEHNVAAERGDPTPFPGYGCCGGTDYERCMCTSWWSFQDGEGGPVGVNYTAADPAPRCPSAAPGTRPPMAAPTPTATPTAASAAAAGPGGGRGGAAFAAAAAALAAVFVVAGGTP